MSQAMGSGSSATITWRLVSERGFDLVNRSRLVLFETPSQQAVNGELASVLLEAEDVLSAHPMILDLCMQECHIRRPSAFNYSAAQWVGCITLAAKRQSDVEHPIPAPMIRAQDNPTRSESCRSLKSAKMYIT
jgi:hypothetical protein